MDYINLMLFIKFSGNEVSIHAVQFSQSSWEYYHVDFFLKNLPVYLITISKKICLF